jgi:hypothetical protein
MCRVIDQCKRMLKYNIINLSKLGQYKSAMRLLTYCTVYKIITLLLFSHINIIQHLCSKHFLFKYVSQIAKFSYKHFNNEFCSAIYL